MPSANGDQAMSNVSRGTQWGLLLMGVMLTLKFGAAALTWAMTGEPAFEWKHRSYFGSQAAAAIVSFLSIGLILLVTSVRNLRPWR